MDLINGKALTFLRRAVSEDLQDINLVEVGIFLKDSFSSTGLSLDGEELALAARATVGYAYLIQLVGYYVWQRGDEHRTASNRIDEQDVETGIAIVMARFHKAVHEPAIAGLSKGAVEYLIAMAQDDGASSTSEVAKRMGKEAKATSFYRRVLIQREIIQSPACGYVDFIVPFLREYVRENSEDLLGRY